MVIVYLSTDFPAENQPLAQPITNLIPNVMLNFLKNSQN